MSLPILQPGQSRDDLVRLFHKCDLQFASGICESASLGCGTALFNPGLPRVYDAHRMVDASLSDDAPSPMRALEEVERFYVDMGLTCWKWVFNPAAPAARVQPMADHLVSLRYRREPYAILRLARAQTITAPTPTDVQILPARASFRHWRQIAQDAASLWPDAAGEIAQAAVDHLDDPHYDAMVAIRGGRAVGRIGVLTVGELGLIEHVHVAATDRRQGIATVLVARALEICGRALHRHVMLRCAADNEAAHRLYARFGFVQIGEFVEYVSPG